ncbi:hypothetical protein [Ruegeria arenilitoris]|uniref:hypothetical protein n=1 Tax=Ruegeria arenilitoris TaxID=1173585 RepID=UPI0020C3FF51|nr:hypothetical protein [Ruegeria arenilitoris]
MNSDSFAFMFRIFINTLIILVLTVLTQVGGLAWGIALFFKKRLISFVVAYAALSLAAIWIAPQFGRVALSCTEDGPLQVQSWMYCVLNRNYVSPELADVLQDAANKMDRQYPGTTTLVLDANFPFLNGFPLPPHLSHDDGEKADLAFYYAEDGSYLNGATRSPIGYFAFEQSSTNCPKRWPTLRWDFDFLQPLWRSYSIDRQRIRSVLIVLSEDDRVGKIFVEPHLAKSLHVSGPKIRSQGCRAARHDDHIHFQL